MEVCHYSRRGGIHAGRGEENQDVYRIWEGEEYFAVGLADGCSSSARAREGAETALLAVGELIAQEGPSFFRGPERRIRCELCRQVSGFLRAASRREGALLSDFASTLMLGFMERDTGRAVVLSLGDGVVLKLRRPHPDVVLGPLRIEGCPCLTTTREAPQFCALQRLQLAYGEGILLGSDGFWAQRSCTDLAGQILQQDFTGIDRALDSSVPADDCTYVAFTRWGK